MPEHGPKFSLEKHPEVSNADVLTETQARLEGWKSAGSLADEFKTYPELVKKLAEKHTSEHPNWIKTFRVKKGVASGTNYHPDLVEILAKELTEISSARENIEYSPEGWCTISSAARILGLKDKLRVKTLAEKFRTNHPEWFAEYKTSRGFIFEHYHPELVQKLKEAEDATEKYGEPPEGWVNVHGLAKSFGISPNSLRKAVNKYRASNPVWFGLFRPKSVSLQTEYFHPDLVEKIKDELGATIKLRTETTQAPEGWITVPSLAKEFKGAYPKLIRKLADKHLAIHPEWVGKYKDRGGFKIAVTYHPDLATELRKELFVILSAREGIESAPEGWMTQAALLKELGYSNWQKMKDLAEKYRAEHPDWFSIHKHTKGSVYEYYHPELIQRIKDSLIEQLVERSETEEAPQGWLNSHALRKALGVSAHKIKELEDKYRNDRPEWFKKYKGENGWILEHLHPNLVEAIKEDLNSYAELRGATEVALEGWESASEFSKRRNKGWIPKIQKMADHFRISNPDWIRKYRHPVVGRITDFYHPDLIRALESEFALESDRKNLPDKLVNLVIEIAEGDSLDAQTFRTLVHVFGPSRYLDVLYKFRPEYKGLPVEYVKGVIAQYLGDFLILKGEFRPDDIRVAAEHLSELSLQEGLIENLKDYCLHYYLKNKSTGGSAQDIIMTCIEGFRVKLGSNSNPILEEVLGKLEAYYNSLFSDFQKPDRFIDQLDEKREFPDVNQRINIKELAEKKRLLIADEMGVGKSASILMAKENLGVKCALIVAPSNVLETWRRYLSATMKGGYYRLGMAPNVLLVESVEELDMEGIAEPYDYVLISQERLNKKYVDALQKLDYDMLVVDEAHKLKSLEGVRTDSLLQLAEKISSNDQYLAMLSGTPVPNKIEDIAVTLKLLYPDRFQHEDNKEFAQKIIRGDLIDLRSLLVPRMQMKGLRESIEMPNLNEELREIELSQQEKEIYEILIENDEITASEKLRTLRLFVMNPDTVDATPGLTSSKIERLSASLQDVFTNKKKILLFVNDYIEGIIRGDKTILAKLNLPEDVQVLVVRGEVPTDERDRIQQEFNQGEGKMLLVVSGQTADVGVDYSGAEEIIFYNEPWTEYQRRQELGRAYRPGLKHDLTSATMLTNETIEDGIHEYIVRKYNAVEKLLRGIPTTDLEKELLSQDERGIQADLSVTPELAEYYFSSWDKMVKIFRYVKEIGEVDLQKFLSKYGEDYARCYNELGNRSYQANANRIAGTLIDHFMKEDGQNRETIRILDLASGPEMLKKHSRDELTDRIISIDINSAHFQGDNSENRVIGSLTRLPFENSSFDYLNLTFALHYSRFVPSRKEYERLEVLQEMNRVLRTGGRGIIDLVYSLDFKDFGAFKKHIRELGFEVDDNYTGNIESESRYKSKIITLKKIRDLAPDFSIEKLVKSMNREELNGFKFDDVEGKLKDSRRIITSFRLGDQDYDIDFNSADKNVYTEEQQILMTAGELRGQYGDIESIPAEEVINNKFIRLKSGAHYILFKRLTAGPGGVIVK